MSSGTKVRLCLFVLVFVASVLPAMAQMQAGSIVAKAVDESGAVLPGVSVTITSPVLPSSLTGVTDVSGVYRFVSLTIGTYTVKATLEGFQTSSRTAIVQQGQTAEAAMLMKIGTLTDEVTVVAETPVVDPITTGVSVNIDRNLLENTPGGKDIWSLLEAKAPGVILSGTPDVGGNQGGLQRGMSARGVPSSQNTQMLNGVNVGDPGSLGAAMNYYTPETFENVQIATAAQDISIGQGGIMINMVSRAGSNRFGGQVSGTCQGDCNLVDTQATNIDDPLRAAGLGPVSNTTGIITNWNVQAGGPLVRNQLFYFGSLNNQSTHVNVAGFPAIPPPAITIQNADASVQDTTDILAGEVKLTYQLDGKNRFDSYLSRQKYDKPNRGSSASNTQDSNSKELDYFVVTQATWSYVPTSRMVVDTKLSYNYTEFDLFQKTGMQPLTDSATGIIYRNRASTSLMFPRRMEFMSNVSYAVPKFLGGRHDFRGGIDNGYTPERVATERVDNATLTMTTASGVIKPSQVTVYNTPSRVDRAVMNTFLYGQDMYSIKRLTVTAGVRWERVEGYLPVQHTPASQFFSEGQVFSNITISGIAYPTYTVQKTFAPVRQDPLWHNFAPRVAVTYALDSDSKTVVKFSAGKYLDQIGTGTPPNPNGTISQTYAWADSNGDLVFQPGNFVWDGAKNAYVGGEFGALASTTIPNPAAGFDKDLKRPSRNEITVSVDREVLPGLLASVSFQHMREHNNQGSVDQSIDSWPENYTLVQLTDPGRDGVLGTGDEQPIGVYSLNPGVIVSNKTVNDDRLATHYNGLEINVSKRYTKGFQILSGYTYSHTRQDLTGLSSPNAVYVNAGGESGGRRHNFKLSGSYQLPYQLLFAANFRIASGLPITRTWAVPACSGGVTANCLTTGVTVNAEPRGSVTLTPLGQIDLRLGRFFKIGAHKLDASVDLYNLTNANTVFAVRQTTSTTNVRYDNDPANPVTTIASFQSPTGALSPRILRFNVRYAF